MVHHHIGCFRASLSRFKCTVRSIGINLWTLDVKRGSAGKRHATEIRAANEMERTGISQQLSSRSQDNKSGILLNTIESNHTMSLNIALFGESSSYTGDTDQAPQWRRLRYCLDNVVELSIPISV